MRDIKFRVWYHGRMFYNPYIQGRDQINDIFNGKKNKYVWMQYTGLRDKNGKYIYEGDIWKDDDGYFGEIRDSNYGWVVTDLDALYDCLAYGYVVGNIYETPELIGE